MDEAAEELVDHKLELLDEVHGCPFPLYEYAYVHAVARDCMRLHEALSRSLS